MAKTITVTIAVVKGNAISVWAAIRAGAPRERPGQLSSTVFGTRNGSSNSPAKTRRPRRRGAARPRAAQGPAPIPPRTLRRLMDADIIIPPPLGDPMPVVLEEEGAFAYIANTIPGIGVALLRANQLKLY